MSMYYKVIEKVNPQDPKGAKLFGAQTIFRSEFNFDELCEWISLRCSMTDSDVEAVLQAFITNATILVLNSKNVDLGKLGYLTAAIKTDLVDSPDVYDKSNIRGMHIVFVPSPKLREEMSRVNLVRKDPVEKKVEG